MVMAATLIAFAAAPANAQTGAGTSARAQAGGIRAIPSAIEVEDGLAGSVVFRPLRLTNGIDPSEPFQLAVEGDVASWISFVVDDDRETPIVEILDDGEGSTVLVRIEIPENAPVGFNEGLLTAVLQDKEGGEEGSGPVGAGLAIPIRVNVTGELILAGELLSMNVETSEVGLPVRGSVVVRNTGNTTVVPDVTFEVFQGTSSIYRTSSIGSALFPDETDTFETVWDTTNAAQGDYRATMSVAFDTLELGSREATFKLVESGSLLRQVVFTSLELANEPVAGGLVRLEAVASNPGLAEIRTVLIGELLRDGVVVEQIRSLDHVVRADNSTTIPMVLDVPEAGDYVFSAYLTYEDGETESQQVTFTVGAAGEAAAAVPTESDGSSMLPWILAGLLGLVIVALLVALFSRRARKSPSSAGTTAAEPTEAPAGESAR